MTEEKIASRIFNKVYNNKVNPFTPVIVERGLSKNKRFAYEMSKQSDYEQKDLLDFEYALTVLENVNGVWEKRSDLSGSHHSSITVARDHVNSFD